MATPQPDPQATPPALRGHRVLVCRPEPEASRLASALTAAGADVRLLPLMAREPLPETPEQRSRLQELDNFSHVIAVSPYAARRLLEEIDQWWPQIPMGIQWYGVGSGTAAELARHGLRVRRPANGWTSEALLAMPSLQTLDNERILLARGEHGRELIRQTLEQRGASVTVLPLYRRYRPYYPAEQIREIFDQFQPEVIVALSGETLNNLVEIIPDNRPELYQSLLVVPAQRVAEQARAIGFRQPFVPQGLADTELIASLAQQLAPPASDNGKPSKDACD